MQTPDKAWNIHKRSQHLQITNTEPFTWTQLLFSWWGHQVLDFHCGFLSCSWCAQAHLWPNNITVQGQQKESGQRQLNKTRLQTESLLVLHCPAAKAAACSCMRCIAQINNHWWHFRPAEVINGPWLPSLSQMSGKYWSIGSKFPRADLG